jgi:hypothetical protein
MAAGRAVLLVFEGGKTRSVPDNMKLSRDYRCASLANCV